MNNQIQIFTNAEFGAIRTVRDEQTGEPWFLAKDVCDALGYDQARKAVARHVDEGDGMKRTTPTSSGDQEMLYINESGLYSLMILSKLPQAKPFKHWVTSEVLPSIRKHGAYMTQDTADRAISDTSYLVGLAKDLQKEHERRKALQNELNEKDQLIAKKKEEIAILDAKISELQPKAKYYEWLVGSEDLLCASNIASEYDMRAREFNLKLAELGVFDKQRKGGQWTLRTAYMNKGYTETATYWDSKNQRIRTSSLTKWTQWGHEFLYHFLKQHGLIPVSERPKQLTLFDTIR